MPRSSKRPKKKGVKAKISRKKKRNVKSVAPVALKEQWDKTLTLKQNFDKIGLLMNTKREQPLPTNPIGKFHFSCLPFFSTFLMHRLFLQRIDRVECARSERKETSKTQ